MDVDIKTKWVKALRDRELPDGRKIKQTKDVLRKPIGEDKRIPLCCLGVLCEIAVLEGVIPAPTFLDAYGGAAVWYDISEETGKYTYEDEDLPPSVVAWAGLNSSNPKVDYSAEGETALSVINDDLDEGFDDIADLIQNNL